MIRSFARHASQSLHRHGLRDTTTTSSSSSSWSSWSMKVAMTRRSISHANLTVEKSQSNERFLNRPAKEDLIFGLTLSDHMLAVEWEVGGWKDPRIVPYGDLQISPAASSLQYGLQCFEGTKAYRAEGDDSDLRLFRPDLNLKRLSDSMMRLDMPGADFDRNGLLECIKELVRVDQRWIPSGEGYSLYLRPTVVATHPFLGLASPSSLLLYVITSPVGPYFKSGFRPVRLTADTPYVRAWPGGTGAAKVGGNYGATMKAQAEANARGYEQVLWLFTNDDGDEEVTEVGSMNIFFVLLDRDTGRKELVTAPLTRGDILPGVTRQSILDLAPSWGGGGGGNDNDNDDNLIVSERFLTMAELRAAANEGRLLEAFGAGTACVVCPVSCIQYKGADIEIPATGDITQRMWDAITGIQYGKVEGPDGWSVRLQ